MSVVCIGEAMVEFAPAGGGLWKQGFAGDTLNVAWAIRARGVPVRYLTRVGRDAFSARFRTFLDSAGIGTDDLQEDPQRSIGLYTIETDARGERSFAYWRGQSAARGLILRPPMLAGARLVYLSGITLAVVEDRAGLLAAVREAGVPLAFDPNYRPRLWEDAATARLWIDRAARMAGTILPTHEDESALFGDADSAATRARYVAAGIGEVVVKDGTNPTLFSAGTDSGALAVPAPVRPLDTTGAGDAFNGAYLAARLDGQRAPAAIAAGQAVAGLVVQRPGALVAMAELAAQG